MKRFLNIFILYFTVLALNPCSGGACSHDAATIPTTCHTTCEKDQSQSNDGHDQEGSCCPQFCYCACCGGTIVTFTKEIKTLEIVPPVLISLSEDNFYYTNHTGNLFLANIWQPPRFC